MSDKHKQFVDELIAKAVADFIGTMYDIRPMPPGWQKIRNVTRTEFRNLVPPPEQK